VAGSGDLRIPAVRLRGSYRAIWPGRVHDVPQLSVVPAALQRIGPPAARADRSPYRAAEAGQAAHALHGTRSHQAPLHAHDVSAGKRVGGGQTAGTSVRLSL